MSDPKPEAGPFFLTPEGNRSDEGLYDSMLDDEEANLAFDLDVIKRVMASGQSLESALESFGTPAVRQHFKDAGLLD
jgi:hypothetical protein